MNETDPYDLRGMEPKAAREYLFAHATTLGLLEKKLEGKAALLEKWRERQSLALNAGRPELAAEAERQVSAGQAEMDALNAEAEALRAGIEKMKRQIPGLDARERRVDPDLLLAELRELSGQDPEGTDAEFGKLEKDSEAADALAELKKKLAEGDIPKA
jgi:phage shock protein A